MQSNLSWFFLNTCTFHEFSLKEITISWQRISQKKTSIIRLNIISWTVFNYEYFFIIDRICWQWNIPWTELHSRTCCPKGRDKASLTRILFQNEMIVLGIISLGNNVCGQYFTWNIVQRTISHWGYYFMLHLFFLFWVSYTVFFFLSCWVAMVLAVYFRLMSSVKMSF